jgi:hypothetical protein
MMMPLKYSQNTYLFMIFAALIILSMGCGSTKDQSGTLVEIQKNQFYINGKLTYEGRIWNGFPIEGLLMNSRMVQGVFDDINPETAKKWKYPDTGEWDPDRNTDEFISAMDEWYSHGLLAFTINLQGGSPMGYGNEGWQNSAFDPKGMPREAYFNRMGKILNKADEIGMVVILGIFYFGQDQYLEGDEAIYAAIDYTIEWLFDSGYRNLLIEVNNECNVNAWDHKILTDPNVHELITHVRSKEKNGYRFLAGTSYGGGAIPSPEVVGVSDFVLIHGNGVGDPERIRKMVSQVKSLPTYSSQPILFNEDDHYDFDQPLNNFIAAVESYASWGYFDFRRDGEAFEDGYQSVPVDWRISSERKKAFFNLVAEITGKTP